MNLRYYAKRLLQRTANRVGYDLVPQDDDVVLQELLQAQNELHRYPGEILRWSERLPRAASYHHLRQLLQLHEIDLVIDVGANRGQFGELLRRLGYRGEIVSFEPQSTVRLALTQAAARDGQWRVRREAVAAVAGTAELHVYASDCLSSLHSVSSVAAHRTAGDLRQTATETVPVVSLDAVWPELAGRRERRVFLKTDTQGHDREVLQGARESLRTVRAVMTEGSAIPIYQDVPRFPELIVLVEAAGFALSGIFPIANQAADLALIEVDCFFTRPLA